MKKTKKLKTRYSGPKSQKFWDTVNALPEPYKSEMYSCGVLLQNMEERVLKWLEHAQKDAQSKNNLQGERNEA